jgi:hypothetical protein
MTWAGIQEKALVETTASGNSPYFQQLAYLRVCPSGQPA